MFERRRQYLPGQFLCRQAVVVFQQPGHPVFPELRALPVLEFVNSVGQQDQHVAGPHLQEFARAGFVQVQHPHRELTITATNTVETAPPVVPAPDQTPPWETVARQLAALPASVLLEPYQFVFASPLIAITPDTRAYAQSSFPQGRPLLAGALDLIARIFTDFTYDKGATTVDTSVDQVLASRKGVCQDFAHLAIGCLRSLGLAARYVSGYLETKPPQGKPKLIGADASHAWLSLFIPDTGWVDLDPTNNLMPGESYTTVSWGRDYGDVTPVKGVVMGGGAHTLSVKVDVKAHA